jgi:DNA repair ATPase RecN
MLIYIHALGYQVATKELAIRAYSDNAEKREQHAALFDFLTRQTSWIPSQELEIKTKEFEIQKDTLQELNRALSDSISQLKGRLRLTTSLDENNRETENLLNRLRTLSDSSSFYNSMYRKCAASNAILKDSMVALNEHLRRISSYSNTEKGLSEKQAVLVRRIEEKNTLINKWNQTMLGLKLPAADMERVMNGYMGDEQYYRKLFRPIPTNVQ